MTDEKIETIALNADPNVIEPEEAETEDPWTPEIVAGDERPEAGIVPDIPEDDDLDPAEQFVDGEGNPIERNTEAG